MTDESAPERAPDDSSDDVGAHARSDGPDGAEQGGVPTDATMAPAGPVGEDLEDPAEIDTEELTVSQRSLHPRIRVVWLFRAALSAAVVGGIAGAIEWFWLDVGPLLPAGVGAVLLVLGAVHAVLRYRVWRYEVREDALYLERGVVTRVRTVVPLVRIQHVDTSRGPVERATGLATCVVYTAGSRGADVAIPGLQADRADDLQHRLKRLAIASEADTSV